MAMGGIRTAAVGDQEDPRLRQWIEEWAEERDVERRQGLAWDIALLLQGTLENVGRAKVRELAGRGVSLAPHDVVNETQSVMQDLLLTFVKKSAGEGLIGFPSYVARAAWHIGSDLVARSWRERAFLERLSEDAGMYLERSIPSTPSGHHVRDELNIVVARAVAKLSDRDRTIVLRRTNEQASFDAIAFQLGLCRSVVIYHWKRALRSLRRELGNAMGGDPLLE